MSSPRLLLTNFHSLQNGGDAALLQVSLAQLRLEFPQVRLTLLANYPDETGLSALGVEVLPSPAALCGSFSGAAPFRQLINLFKGLLQPTGGWMKLRQAMAEVDFVLSCAGNPFFSMGRVGWPLLLSSLPLVLAHKAGAPYLLLPQTLGPLKRHWERVWMRSILRHARGVFLREEDSHKQAAALGTPPERISAVADPCFLLKPADEADARMMLYRYGWCPGQPALGVNLVPQMVHTLSAAQLAQVYQSFADVLENFANQHKVRLFFFAQSTGPTLREDDRLPARQVMAALPVGCEAVLVDEPLNPAQLKACYGQMDALVCMRLHAGLFALGAATPALFIGYLPKTGAVLNTLGWQQWGIDLSDCKTPVLGKRLSALWQQRQELHQRLKNLSPNWERCAAGAYQQLTDLIRAEGA
jgi:polysaccharide pyruvyl transferase WcaK-like protein